MSLPIFFIDTLSSYTEVVLSEEASRHIVQVLRMKTGEALQLTDGKGNLWLARILDDHKKKTRVEIERHEFKPARTRKTAIAISLIKNTSRFEWFLEKATEIGITSIIPLICDRTEKQHFRHDRMNGILISAMLQSQQVWMPELTDPVAFGKFVPDTSYAQKFIAHCEEDQKNSLAGRPGQEPAVILIGPEGDFSRYEIKLALEHGFVPVSLGETRLRTETAGIVAATILQLTGSAG